MANDWKSRLNAMIRMMEAGLCDDRQLQELMDVLETKPHEVLPQYVGLSNYVAFLCTKVHRAKLARQMLYATLGFDLQADGRPDDIAIDVANITHVEKLLGRDFDAAQIRKAALDKSYRAT